MSISSLSYPWQERINPGPMFNEILLQLCLLFLVSAVITSSMATELLDENNPNKSDNLTFSVMNSTVSEYENEKLEDDINTLEKAYLPSNVSLSNKSEDSKNITNQINLQGDVIRLDNLDSIKKMINETELTGDVIPLNKLEVLKNISNETNLSSGVVLLYKLEDSNNKSNRPHLLSDDIPLDKLEDSHNISNDKYFPDGFIRLDELKNSEYTSNETHLLYYPTRLFKLEDSKIETNETRLLGDRIRLEKLGVSDHTPNETQLLSDIIHLDELEKLQNIRNQTHLQSDVIRLEKTHNLKNITNETQILTNETSLLSALDGLDNKKITSQSMNENRTASVRFSATNTSLNTSQYNNATLNLVGDEEEISNLWKTIKEEVEEIIKGNEFCNSWKHTCLRNNTKGHRYLPQNKTISQLCECDSDCGSYRDCCMDLSSSLGQPQFIEHADELYCGNLHYRSNKSLPGILMLDQCLNSKEEPAKNHWLCQKKVPEASLTFILDVPVTSSKTNLTYRNYYCAFCNNDTDELVELNISVSCKHQQIARHLKFSEFLEKARITAALPEDSYTLYLERIDENGAFYRNKECQLDIKEYEDVTKFASLHNSRICHNPEKSCSNEAESRNSTCIKEIRYCNPNWNVSSDIEKCKMYSLEVIDLTENIVYKNPHCAICNNVDVFSGNISCSLRAGASGKRKTESTLSGMFEVQKSQKCTNHNEIWDSWRGKCSPILCEESHIVWWAKKCIKVFSTDERIRVDPYAEASCPRIALNEGDYESFNNGSIYSLLNKKIYKINEFKLFNDSVLVCAEPELYQAHSYTTFVVLSISIICLLIHIILYLCFPSRKTWHSRNLFLMCCSLFLAQLLSLVGTTATDNLNLCMFLSVSLHYFWLASFCWMNVLSIDVWRTFNNQLNYNSISKSNMFKIYNIYSWGVPFLIALSALILDLNNFLPKYRPRYARFYSKRLCWINNRRGLITFFIVPVGIIVMVNFLLFLMTSYGLYKQFKEVKRALTQCKSVKVGKMANSPPTQMPKTLQVNRHQKKNQPKLTLYMKLGFLQGLTWMTVFVSAFVSSPIASHAFTIMNGLQGAAILISFDLKDWIFHSLWEGVTSISQRSKYASKNSQTTSCERSAKKGSSNQDEFQITSEGHEGIAVTETNPQRHNRLRDKKSITSNVSTTSIIAFDSSPALPSCTSCKIESEADKAMSSNITIKSSDNFQEFPEEKEANECINLSIQDQHPNIHTVTIECNEEKGGKVSNKETPNCDLHAADEIKKKDKIRKLLCQSSCLDNPSFVWDEMNINPGKDEEKVERIARNSFKISPSRKISIQRYVRRHSITGVDTTKELQDQKISAGRDLSTEFHSSKIPKLPNEEPSCYINIVDKEI